MPGRPQFPQANCILIWGLGRYRPDGCSPRHPQDHASWPPLPAFPDVPEHPDERSPSCQARCHSWTDALLLATLAVMFGINRWTGVSSGARCRWTASPPGSRPFRNCRRHRPGRGPCSDTDREPDLQVPHALGQRLRHGQSATGNLETLPGQSTAAQA